MKYYLISMSAPMGVFILFGLFLISTFIGQTNDLHSLGINRQTTTETQTEPQPESESSRGSGRRDA